MFGFIRPNKVGPIGLSDILVGHMTKPNPWTSLYWK